MSAIVADLSVESAFLKISTIARRERWPVLSLPRTQRLIELRERRDLRAHIEANATNGTMFVLCHGYDCDGVTYSYVTQIAADIGAFDAFTDRELAHADGPAHFSIISPAAARAFRPEPSRDLHAEAHENGRPWLIAA